MIFISALIASRNLTVASDDAKSVSGRWSELPSGAQPFEAHPQLRFLGPKRPHPPLTALAAGVSAVRTLKAP